MPELSLVMNHLKLNLRARYEQLLGVNSRAGPEYSNIHSVDWYSIWKCDIRIFVVVFFVWVFCTEKY